MATVKDEHKGAVIAHNKTAIPLGERTPEEVNNLAAMAVRSNDKYLLKMFDNLPTVEELNTEKEKTVLQKISVPESNNLKRETTPGE